MRVSVKQARGLGDTSPPPLTFFHYFKEVPTVTSSVGFLEGGQFQCEGAPVALPLGIDSDLPVMQLHNAFCN